jgi:hypothetical protein
MRNEKTKITLDDLISRQSAILSFFCTKIPPRRLIKLQYVYQEPGLQDWVVDHLKPKFNYATGYQIICSAEDISRSQIDNGLEELTE